MDEMLDKQKILDHLKQLGAKLRKQKRIKMVLSRELMRYFKSKDIDRAFVKDSADQQEIFQEQYRDALDQFFGLRERKIEIQTQMKMYLDLARSKQEDKLNKRKELHENFCSRLMEVGVTLQSSKTGNFLTEKAINRQIKRFNDALKALEDVRLNYLMTLNRASTLKKERYDMDNLGNGLRVINFEQLRADVQNLSDKLENRENELAKLRIRHAGDTQILAHSREKEFMFHDVLQEKKTEYEEIQKIAENERKYLNVQKSKRDALRKKAKDMEVENGLLFFTPLLKGFDEMVDKTGELKEKIEILRQNTEDMRKKERELQKIIKLEDF